MEFQTHGEHGGRGRVSECREDSLVPLKSHQYLSCSRVMGKAGPQPALKFLSCFVSKYKDNAMMKKNKGERASHCFKEAKFYYQDVWCRVFLGAEWRPVQLSPPNSFSSLWFGPQTMQPETKTSVLKFPSGSTVGAKICRFPVPTT